MMETTGGSKLSDLIAKGTAYTLAGGGSRHSYTDAGENRVVQVSVKILRVIIKRTSGLKKNLVEGEHYRVSRAFIRQGQVEDYQDAVFAGYERGPDNTKVALKFRGFPDISLSEEGVACEWLYWENESDLSYDPLACADLAHAYIKHGLVVGKDAHAVAWDVQCGWRPWLTTTEKEKPTMLLAGVGKEGVIEQS